MMKRTLLIVGALVLPTIASAQRPEGFVTPANAAAMTASQAARRPVVRTMANLEDGDLFMQVYVVEDADCDDPAPNEDELRGEQKRHTYKMVYALLTSGDYRPVPVISKKCKREEPCEDRALAEALAAALLKCHTPPPPPVRDYHGLIVFQVDTRVTCPQPAPPVVVMRPSAYGTGNQCSGYSQFYWRWNVRYPTFSTGFHRGGFGRSGFH